MQVNVAILRLLYLTESFVNSANSFNGVACATTVKGMVEIPLNLGYLLWIISSGHSFETIRSEIAKIAYGQKDLKTQLTSQKVIKHKEMYIKADEMVRKLFNEDETKDTFEIMFKESNAIGHHNVEATMFCGLQNDKGWHLKDRKEMFVFLSSNIFQIFLFASTILFMTTIFLEAIRHGLDAMPDYLE